MYSENYDVARKKYFNDFLDKKKPKFFIEIIDRFKPKTCLDVGSGNGLFSLEMCNHFKSFVGIEVSDRICFAKKYLRQSGKKNIRFIRGDARKMSFDDNSFDLVYCTGVVEHIPDVDDAIKEIARVSKKYVLIDTPTWRWEVYHFFKFWLWVITHPVYVVKRTFEKVKTENATVGGLAKKSWNEAHINKWNISKWRSVFQKNGVKIIDEKIINFGMTYVVLGVKDNK